MSADPVTELDGSDEALERERRRYAELFDLSPVGFIVTDAVGLILEANAAFGNLVAADPNRLAGKPVAVFVPIDQRKRFREELAEAARVLGRHRWRTELIGRDGARVDVEVMVAVTAALPDLLRLRWALVDVSERSIHAERERQLASEYEERALERTAELEHQRALLQAVIENIPDGILVVDADLKPIVLNEEASRLLGIAQTDGEDAFDAWRRAKLFRLDGTPVGDDERPVFKTLRNGEVIAAETYEVVLDERHAVFELSTAPVSLHSGERVGAVAVLRDVTVRERTELAEREFVTNAAHELQSPLAAIVSTIEVLQAGAKDGPERDTFLGHIEREADRLARLARALLILARTQVGVEAPRDELVAVGPLLEEVAGALRLADGTRLEVACEKELAMLTNRELVEQALINLAENAAKHTTKGKIVLSAAQVEDRVVEFQVSDTGPGIPAAERSKVFQRFYRSGDGAAGFGLGLAIVRSVAEALDGEIALDSGVGTGTTVRLRVPGAARLVDR